MSVHSWTNREKNLIKGAVVEKFTIEKVELREGCACAVGMMGLVDYTATRDNKRHIAVSWYASSPLSNGKSTDWLVRKSEQEARFTRDIIHDALCVFIRRELEDFFETNTISALKSKGKSSCVVAPDTDATCVSVSNGSSHESPPTITATMVGTDATAPPLQRVGRMCVCGELYASNIHTPFRSHWRNGSEGFSRAEGTYRCILCNCGQRWWQVRPELAKWVRIVDETCWRVLLAHHGSPPKGLVCVLLDTAFLTDIPKSIFQKIPLAIAV